MGKAAATADIELIAIGNSKGIRLPKVLLRKYGWSDVWRSAGSIPRRWRSFRSFWRTLMVSIGLRIDVDSSGRTPGNPNA